jgi:hypothetical protein
VVVNTDICTQWIVVRTSSNSEVDGRIRRTLDKDRERLGRGEKRVGHCIAEAVPGAIVVRPKHNLLETKLPIDHILRRGPKEPFPNPFEVATAYVDAFTNTRGTWRAQLILENTKNKNGDFWLLTVRDEVSKVDLFTVTAKELDTRGRGPILSIPGVPGMDERLPLERMGSTDSAKPPLSVWERLRQIEYNPNPSLDDDEDSLS